MSEKQTSVSDYSGYIAIAGFGVVTVAAWYFYTRLLESQAEIDKLRKEMETLKESLRVNCGNGKPIATVVEDVVKRMGECEESMKSLQANITRLECAPPMPQIPSTQMGHYSGFAPGMQYSKTQMPPPSGLYHQGMMPPSQYMTANAGFKQAPARDISDPKELANIMNAFPSDD